MPIPVPPESFEYLLVGGGLQNALIALALLRNRPRTRVAIIEREDELGGNHLWCYHAGDLSPGMTDVVAPMVVKRWDGYDVAFPALDRRIDEPYAAVSSATLNRTLQDVLRAHAQAALFTGRAASHVGADRVILDDGTVLRGEVVVEALGPEKRAPEVRDGYQKFLGMALRLRRPLERQVPLVMDARVAQLEGFRFLYVLPLEADLVLIEDTRFSTSPSLDRAAMREEITHYASSAGLEIASVDREEVGVLPLPTRASRASQPEGRGKHGSFVAGYQGGWFHPVSGYSFPVAARVADVIASVKPRDLAPAWAALEREHAKQVRFAILLNRMFFGAFADEDRRHVIERFYRLPIGTIRRFYSLSLTPMDRARIVCGRPPVGFSIRRAIAGGKPA